MGFLNLIARALQALFALIVLGLTAYVASVYDDHEDLIGDSPSEINFLIFVAVWTLLVIGFLMLAPKFFPKAAHNIVILALEFLTMIFWFAGFVSLAVDVGAYGCDVLEDVNNIEIDECQSTDASAKAAVAFAAFTWLLFAYTFLMGALNFWKNRSSTGTNNPEMHQGA